MKKKSSISRTEYLLLAIIAAYCIGVSLKNPMFASVETLFDMIRSSASTMVMAMGVLVVIISGGIDVSFTAIMLFGGYASTLLAVNTGINNLFVLFAVSCAIGIGLGAVNALIVYYSKLPIFIATLGTINIIHGMMTTFLGTKNLGASIVPSCIKDFGMNPLLTITTRGGQHYDLTLFLIPVVLIIFITWIILYKTTIGRGVFALGNSRESASRSGYSILKTQLFVFCYEGFVAGIAGVIYVATVSAIQPVFLVGTELNIIAAVLIGGANPNGGMGKVFGTILGVLIMYLLKSTLIFLGLSSSWEDMFIGLILIVSIALTSYPEKRKKHDNLIF